LEPNCITTALRALLEPQMVNAQGQPFMKFWRVNETQANANSLRASSPSVDPSQGVGLFNRNSATQPLASLGSPLSPGGYAVVYGSVPDDMPPNAAHCEANPPQPGAFSATGGAEQNDGSSMVNIDLPEVIACANMFRLSPNATQGYPQDALISNLVAHEMGHTFGLEHLYRPAAWTGWVNLAPADAGLAAAVSPLGFEGYLINSSPPGNFAVMYLRLNASLVYVLNAATGTTRRVGLHLEDLDEEPALTCHSTTRITGTVAQYSSQDFSAIYAESNCSPTTIPVYPSPLPAEPPCFSRYVTTNPVEDPFLKVKTAGVPTSSRGRLDPGAGFDLMGVWSPLTTLYSFDPGCELPHLRVTPLGN
jgi:hypothetical protein